MLWHVISMLLMSDRTCDFNYCQQCNNPIYLHRQEDAELQEAIRRSLEEENSRRPYPPRGNPGSSEPRGYTPSEPRGYSPGRLYPDLSPQPSAPPAPEYGGGGYHDNYHDPSQAPGLPADLDEIRRRRVHRFE